MFEKQILIKIALHYLILQIKDFIKWLKIKYNNAEIEAIHEKISVLKLSLQISHNLYLKKTI